MKGLLVFIEMKGKKNVVEKKNNMTDSKKTHFPAPPILNIFHENFMDW